MEWGAVYTWPECVPVHTGGPSSSSGRKRLLPPSPTSMSFTPLISLSSPNYPFFHSLHTFLQWPFPVSTQATILPILSHMKDCSVRSSLETHQVLWLHEAVTWGPLLPCYRGTNSNTKVSPACSGCAGRTSCGLVRLGEVVLHDVSKGRRFPRCPTACQNIPCVYMVNPKRTSVSIDTQR